MRSASMYEDRRSIISASSGCSTLTDVSQRSTGAQLRKFTASVGRPGQAREAREAVRAVLTVVNPTRKSPLAKPLDYETFVSGKRAQLDSDSQRDLVLFPRDDIGETKVVGSEGQLITTLEQDRLGAQWLLTEEALKLYSSAAKVVEFRYASFSGDFDVQATEVPFELYPLPYESDIALEEEKAILEGQVFTTSDIINEGYLFVVPESGILDNFKSAKKRYCIFKKEDDGRVVLELRKSATTAPSRPPLPVKQVFLSKTKKGKSVFEVVGADAEGRTLSFAADVDSDLSRWLFEVDRALMSSHKEDSISVSSLGIAGTSTADSESLQSEDDISFGKDGTPIFRGKNAHVKALQPPIVQRHNLFTLYVDLDPLPIPRGEPCSLLRVESVRSKPSGGLINESRPDKLVVRFTVEFLKLDLKLPYTSFPQQIEPFFVRLFLFDARSGKRLSEEFRVSPRFGLGDLPQDPENLAESKSSLEEDGINGIPYSVLSDPNANKLICAVAQPHRDIYVVARLERILSPDVSADIYMKSASDLKALAKQIKGITAASVRLARYRMPFAWAARPAFQDMLGSRLTEDISPLYKWDGNRMGDADLQKFLNDLAKSEKSGKIAAIPNASISLAVDISARVSEFPMRIGPTFAPVSVWNAAPDTPISPTFELQPFADVASEPHSSLINLLYVYPIMLKYDGQKLFNKARNIVCTVQFIAAGSRGGDSVRAIYDRFAYPKPFVQSARCVVQHHEQNPTFGDEVKIQLPLTLDQTDHLLFTFTHISVQAATQKSSESVEVPAGYAWLPLVKNDRLVMENDEQEVALPVAADLPAGYINYQSLGLGKGHVGPDIRWVDSGKPLFRVRLRLVSSVFTTEAKLQSFFQGCQKLQKVGLLGSSAQKTSPQTSIEEKDLVTPSEGVRPVSQAVEDGSEWEKCIRYVCRKTQALLEVDIDRLIPFLPIVLGRLLSLLQACTTDDMAVTVLTTLIGIVDRTMAKGRTQLLRSFVKFQYCSTCATPVAKNDEETTHAAICKYVFLLACTAQNDPDALGAIFRQLWFLLDVAIKSIAQCVTSVQLYKVPRRERFSPELLRRIKLFVEHMVPLIMAKHRDIPQETRIANTAIAYFLRCCLSFVDRGSVFTWIHYMVTKYDENESRALRDYKLDLLQILAGHEHWIPLALPLLCDNTGELIRKDTASSDRYTSASSMSAGSSTGFFATFVSKMLSLSTNVSETPESNPYMRVLEEFTLTEGYCQRHFLVGLLLQELQCSLREPRDYRKRAIALVRNILAKHTTDKRYPDLRAQTRIATLYLPLLRLALNNLPEIEASLKTAESGEQPLPSAMPTPSTPATAAVRPKRAASAERLLPKLSGPVTIEAPIMNGQSATLHHSVSMSTTAPQIGLSEKLDWGESRDLLLCNLYLLYRVPRKILEALLAEADSNGPPTVADYIKLLELALEFFKYRGLKFTMHKTSSKIRFSKRVVNLGTPSATTASSIGAGTIDSQSSSQASTSSGVSSLAPSSAPTLILDEEPGESLPFSVLQESNLTQEVALIILEIAQVMAQFIARQNKSGAEEDDAVFLRLLRLEVTLLTESWPDAVRLHTLASLAMFVNLFQGRFFKNGPLDGLALLVEALLLQLNSRIIPVQGASAALLHLILRNGYQLALHAGKLESPAVNMWQPSFSSAPQSKRMSIIKLQPVSHTAETLGRPGSQIGVALARLLGQKASLARSPRFERGLSVLESFVSSSVGSKSPVFDKAVGELIVQLRGVLSATGALAAAVNDPIRVADLHIQLADSYRGSAALRSAWFETLAETHIREKWFAEAAVCEAHVLAIMGKELVVNGLASFDWNLFTTINDAVVKEEISFDQVDATEKAGFTLRSFTSKIEKTLQTLVLAERYEAIGPLSRLAIPIYERLRDYRALISMYMELQQAYCLADQVKVTGKRHLGAYFRVFFFSPTYFGEEHRTEWIYREPGLTSLAEAYERMKKAIGLALGHDRVQVLAESKLDESKLSKDVAYIQMTHVEPAGAEGIDSNSFEAHTNVRRFTYESNDVDNSVPADAPTVARQALKRVYLSTTAPFPNTCRRQRVTSRSEVSLNPLELACDKLLYKAEQLRRILEAAAGTDGSKKSVLARLDIKGLQLLLQGAVQPTVNVGPLAYAEAFTAPAQRERYGPDGIKRLGDAFRKLMTVCADALQVNEAAIERDQAEYQQMLKNAFVAMMERLNTYFGEPIPASGAHSPENGAADAKGTPRSSMHILDSIGGVNP